MSVEKRRIDEIYKRLATVEKHIRQLQFLIALLFFVVGVVVWRLVVRWPL
jgi:uncharacterized transporter YbjL